jgi:hypothetical protein
MGGKYRKQVREDAQGAITLSFSVHAAGRIERRKSEVLQPIRSAVTRNGTPVLDSKI